VRADHVGEAAGLVDGENIADEVAWELRVDIDELGE